MNSENSDNEFSFPQSLTTPLADLLNDSYNFDNSYPASLEENNGVQFQFQNQDLSAPVLSHLTTEGNNGLDLASNLEVNKSSVECTSNALENGAPVPQEDPFNISEPVDDYSLYYIMSMGIRYCASLKNNGEGNSNSTAEGNPSNNEVKQIHPVLTSPNEVAGESYGGGTGKSPVEEHHKAPLQHYRPSTLESSMYPGINRYAGNLQTFLRGKPRPQKKGKTVGFKIKEEPVWAYDMESTKFQSKSSTTNFLPSYREDELKEVSKDEYSTALRSKSKDISKGTSTHRGVPRISTKKSDDEKWKAILWSAQECKEPAQASDIPAIRLSGKGKGLQSNDNAGGSYSKGIQEAGQNQTLQFNQNNNFTEQALEKNSSSSQLSQGCQNSDFQTYPSFSYGSGSGMENCAGGCSKNVAAEGSSMKLDNEDDIFSGIWKDSDPLSQFVDDGFILPASENKDFQIHDQNKNCTNQFLQQNPSSSVSHGYTNPNSQDNPALLPKMIDTGFGEKAGGNTSDGSNQGFTSSGNPSPDSTMIETTKVSTKGSTVEASPIKGLTAMENSVDLTFPEIEGLEVFKQNQAEFSFSFDWTNDLLLPTDLCGGGK